MYKPTTSISLSSKFGSLEILNVLADRRLAAAALVHLANPPDAIDFEMLPPLDDRRA